MEPGLAARHPEISTYSGTGIDVPGSTVHLDLGPLGLHASVLGPEGAWYIDPYYHREQSVYVSYFGRDLTRNPHGDFVERDGRRELDPRSPTSARRRRPRRRRSSCGPTDWRSSAIPAYARVLRDGERHRGQGRADEPGQPGLRERPRDPHDAGRRQRQAQLQDGRADDRATNGPCGTRALLHARLRPRSAPAGRWSATQTVIGQIIGAGELRHRAHRAGRERRRHRRARRRRQRASRPRAARACRRRRATSTRSTTSRTRWATSSAATTPSTAIAAPAASATATRARRSSPAAARRSWPTPGSAAQDDLQPHSDPYFSERSIERDRRTTSALARPAVNEVQSVALRELRQPTATRSPSPTTAHRRSRSSAGPTTTPPAIEAAIEAIAGLARRRWSAFGGTAAPPDDAGFQVTFGGTLAGQATALLSGHRRRRGRAASSARSSRGGPVLNGGSTVVDTGNHAPVVDAPARLPDPGADAVPPHRRRHRRRRRPGHLHVGAERRRRRSTAPRWSTTRSATGRSSASSGPRRIVDRRRHARSRRRRARTPPATDPTRVFPDMAQIVAGNTNAATGSCPPRRRPGPGPAGDRRLLLGVPADGRLGRASTTTARCTSGSPPATATRSPVASATRDTAVRIVPGGRAVPGHVAGGPRGSVGGGSQLAGELGSGRAPTRRRSTPPRSRSRLSLDDGKTFPVVLAGATPNDGAADGDAAEHRRRARPDQGRGARHVVLRRLARQPADQSFQRRTPTNG